MTNELPPGLALQKVDDENNDSQCWTAASWFSAT